MYHMFHMWSNAFNLTTPPLTQAIIPNLLFQHEWVLWVHYKRTTTTAGVLAKVATLRCYKDLIEAQNQLDVAKYQSAVSVNLFCFKKGTEPDKLHEGNRDGGCWSAAPESTDPHPRAVLSVWWSKLVLCVINDSMHPDPQVREVIVGVRVTLRQNLGADRLRRIDYQHNRIELWTTDACNEYIQLTIGACMKALLNVYNEITYISHKDVMIHAKNRWQFQNIRFEENQNSNGNQRSGRSRRISRQNSEQNERNGYNQRQDQDWRMVKSNMNIVNRRIIQPIDGAYYNYLNKQRSQVREDQRVIEVSLDRDTEGRLRNKQRERRNNHLRTLTKDNRIITVLLGGSRRNQQNNFRRSRFLLSI
eukprot:TRINITY_DN32140_c0_g1_i2.p1 TRINITY_DN32140_c0_g1~~TRINITY_DN32140_c0_g1_i2.p1  ORF type:complete len:361 (+),score=4.18 TRINITY_DN32140_c0_g1_i2:166-1248(+)